MRAWMPSERQTTLINLIRRRQREAGRTPTYAELAAELRVGVATIQRDVAVLTARGRLVRNRGERRAISVAEAAP